MAGFSSKKSRISNQVTKSEIHDLLEELWENRFEIFFHDPSYPSLSDPGAYFSYSTKKSTGRESWSMTLGNHGWSGGIYHKKIRKSLPYTDSST